MQPIIAGLVNHQFIGRNLQLFRNCLDQRRNVFEPVWQVAAVDVVRYLKPDLDAFIAARRRASRSSAAGADATPPAAREFDR